MGQNQHLEFVSPTNIENVKTRTRPNIVIKYFQTFASIHKPSINSWSSKLIKIIHYDCSIAVHRPIIGIQWEGMEVPAKRIRLFLACCWCNHYIPSSPKAGRYVSNHFNRQMFRGLIMYQYRSTSKQHLGFTLFIVNKRSRIYSIRAEGSHLGFSSFANSENLPKM